jgi:hypothetical protein
VGPRAGLDMCEKSHPHRDTIPGPSSPQPVAILTELPGSHYKSVFYNTLHVLCGVGEGWSRSVGPIV